MRIRPEFAEEMKQEPADALLEIVDRSDGLASGIYFGMRDEDVAMALAQPWTTIGSDGSGLAPTGVLARSHPHPRSYGTFTRVLGALRARAPSVDPASGDSQDDGTAG